MYFKHTKEQQWNSAGYDGAERAVLRMSASNIYVASDQPITLVAT